MNNNSLTYTPLGGAGRVTSNMHLYETESEILIVDCGIGFVDETIIGVELIIPDITYLKTTKKKIVGMAISHGHEDHFGALPFLLPDLPSFPIFASPLTAEFANSKLKEFGVSNRVQKVDFDGGEVRVGSFSLDFIRVTHSVPDTSHIFIKTPIGNFYHGSDYKFEEAPFDGKKSDLQKIERLSSQGVICMMSDCLRAEHKGHIASESMILPALERELAKTPGKFIVTTYSSNIARVGQIVEAAKKQGRKICFVGRSMINTKEMAVRLGYLKIDQGMEVQLDQLRNYKDSNVVMVVAGSQGQEHSALSRIVNGDHKDIKLKSSDTIVFSSDAIPGNEISVNSLIDNIARKGARAIYSTISPDFHVSGHAASEEIAQLMQLVKPQNVVPIGGTYKQMIQYKDIAKQVGIQDHNILLVENGQPVIFTKEGSTLGKKLNLKNVYVDHISGEEVESYVLRDRQKLASDGVVAILIEIDASNGQIIATPNIVARGLLPQEAEDLNKNLVRQIRSELSKKRQPVTDWIYMRKLIGEISEKYIFRNLRKRPLVLPVVIEV
jgi:ribonuclease J